MRLCLLLLLPAVAAAFTVSTTGLASSRTSAAHCRVQTAAIRLSHSTAPTTLLLADAAAAVVDKPEWVAQLEAFQDSHAFIIGIVTALVTRAIINEIRYRIEKPVMDKVGEKVSTELTPDTDRIGTGQWATLALCAGLDFAGDASGALPILGEFTDIGFAPFEAFMIKTLFNSNALAAFGFAEEILPFTDVVPTFTISWALKNLWPTTPLARRLLPSEEGAK